MDFARQVTLLGEEAQQRIERARILIVGAGGLGSPAARYLAAAGVGHITLCDFDDVDATNLHRQILFGPGDEGEPKATLAAERLNDHSDGITIARQETFRPEMVDGHDVVLDCTDEPGTRALIHQACIERQTPLVWAAAEGWQVQWALIPPGGPCLRCLWPTPGDAPSCADTGMLGPIVGLAGVWQALAALRLMAGVDIEPGRLHIVNLQTDEYQAIQFTHRDGCDCAVGAK